MEIEKFWARFREKRMIEAVKGAKELFLERKIESVKMTEIAEKANMGVASLYRYFSTKEAIAIEVATLLWDEIAEEYEKRLYSDEFAFLSGIDEISFILDIYVDLFSKHRDFLLFLSDFDSFCLRHKVEKEKLAFYEESISVFYLPYNGAIDKGLRDGTITLKDDRKVLYLTVNHMVLSFLEKIAEGEILSQDAFFLKELTVMKQIILSYFKREN